MTLQTTLFMSIMLLGGIFHAKYILIELEEGNNAIPRSGVGSQCKYTLFGSQ